MIHDTSETIALRLFAADRDCPPELAQAAWNALPADRQAGFHRMAEAARRWCEDAVARAIIDLETAIES